MEPIMPKDGEPALPARPTASAAKRLPPIPLVISGAVIAVLGVGALLIHHAESATNRVALASEPKPVSVVEAKAASFHAHRSSVGRLYPWVSARVGPQF